MTLEIADVARCCHEANRAYQQALGETPNPRWDALDATMVESILQGVQRAQSGATPEELHQSWLDFKTADGWTYGKVKNPYRKKHPCLVPYEDLPETQRVKDRLFSAIVHALDNS